MYDLWRSSSSSLRFAWFLAHPVLSSNNLKHQPAAAVGARAAPVAAPAASESCGGVLSKWESARACANIQGKACAQVSANVWKPTSILLPVEEHLKSSKFLTVGIELKILVECEFLRPKIDHKCIVISWDLLALTGKVNKQLSVRVLSSHYWNSWQILTSTPN